MEVEKVEKVVKDQEEVNKVISMGSPESQENDTLAIDLEEEDLEQGEINNDDLEKKEEGKEIEGKIVATNERNEVTWYSVCLAKLVGTHIV